VLLAPLLFPQAVPVDLVITVACLLKPVIAFYFRRGAG
jgi:hypothetical protein